MGQHLRMYPSQCGLDITEETWRCLFLCLLPGSRVLNFLELWFPSLFFSLCPWTEAERETEFREHVFTLASM